MRINRSYSRRNDAHQNLYTEAFHSERDNKTTDYEKLLNRGIRELDSSIANLDAAWESCPGGMGEDLDHICRELRQLHNDLETLKDNRSYAENFAKKERRKRVIKEASYGGAYDIEDDQFFTREELNEFGERLADSISEKIEGEPIRYNGAYVDDNLLTVRMESELGEIEKEVKLDFRTIRKPSDIDKYSKVLIPQFIKDFVELGATEL